MEEVSANAIALPRGLRIWLTPPTVYEMHYFNCTNTYRETFVAMHAPRELAGNWASTYDNVFHGIAVACAAVPYVGPALSACVEFGASWWKNANMDGDGGITFYAADHYIGLESGVDLTATPWPGVSEEDWGQVIGALRRGAAAIGHNSVEANLECAPLVLSGRTEGNAPSATVGA